MGCLKATFTHTVPCVQEHWFSLRKIHGQWWNFNSLYPAPQQLSQFYLLAYLATMREQGYSIFVVHGNLPTYPDTSVTSDQGTWYTEAQVLGPLLRIATCKQFLSREFLFAVYPGPCPMLVKTMTQALSVHGSLVAVLRQNATSDCGSFGIAA